MNQLKRTVGLKRPRSDDIDVSCDASPTKLQKTSEKSNLFQITERLNEIHSLLEAVEDAEILVEQMLLNNIIKIERRPSRDEIEKQFRYACVYHLADHHPFIIQHTANICLLGIAKKLGQKEVNMKPIFTTSRRIGAISVRPSIIPKYKASIERLGGVYERDINNADFVIVSSKTNAEHLQKALQNATHPIHLVDYRYLMNCWVNPKNYEETLHQFTFHFSDNQEYTNLNVMRRGFTQVASAIYAKMNESKRVTNLLGCDKHGLEKPELDSLIKFVSGGNVSRKFLQPLSDKFPQTESQSLSYYVRPSNESRNYSEAAKPTAQLAQRRKITARPTSHEIPQEIVEESDTPQDEDLEESSNKTEIIQAPASEAQQLPQKGSRKKFTWRFHLIFGSVLGVLLLIVILFFMSLIDENQHGLVIRTNS